jgi:hypothetical protein
MKEEESSFNLEIKAEADARSLRRNEANKKEDETFKKEMSIIITNAKKTLNIPDNTKLNETQVHQIEDHIKKDVLKLHESHTAAWERFFEQAKAPIKIQKQVEDEKFTNALNSLIEKNKPIQLSGKKAESFEKYYSPILEELKTSHPEASKRFWPENTKSSQNRSESPKSVDQFFRNVEGTTTPPTTPRKGENDQRTRQF